MNVVRHHYPCLQCVAQPVVVKQSFLDQPCRVRLLQEAASLTRVRKLLYPASELSAPIDLGLPCKFQTPTVDNLSRNGIGQPPREELASSFQLDMRQIASGMPTLRHGYPDFSFAIALSTDGSLPFSPLSVTSRSGTNGFFSNRMP